MLADLSNAIARSEDAVRGVHFGAPVNNGVQAALRNTTFSRIKFGFADLP
jgi:hypothetical protein